jgi:hypothetical protein
MPVVTAPTKTNSLQGSDLSMFSGAVGSPVLSVNNYYNGSIMDAGSSMSVSGTTATRNFVYRCCQNGGTLRADLVTSYGGRGGIAFDRNYTIFNGIGEQTIVCGLPI